MKITDEMIKNKHKQFNDRVSVMLNKKAGNTEAARFSPAIQRLRQLAQLRKLTPPS